VSQMSDAELVAAAQAARARAYAPYSKYTVGAVVETEDGELYVGANVENASYGLSVCAERNAIMRMVIEGGSRPRAVYVATGSSPPASPCGSCRQVLLEFSPDPTAVKVVAVNDSGERGEWTVAELIPAGFTGKQLG
jgi:cytidine deaminase